MSTRHPTPGPSNVVLQPLNAVKRTISEDPEELRESKKLRKEPPTPVSAVAVNGKDKKRRRKKKRKASIVVGDVDPKPRSPSKSAPVSTLVPNVKASLTIPPSTMNGAAVEIEGSGLVEEEEAGLSSSDKGKGKDTSESPAPRSPTPPAAEQPLASGSTPPTTESAQQQIVRLTEQLANQTALVARHESHLNITNQSLTCQICLDLLYKPFALAPCGHVACHSCLVRWFTALPNSVPNNENIDQILNNHDGRQGRHLAKRKTCPICRAIVHERPVEVWGIKDMVAALVKSKLVELPVPLAPPTPAAAAAVPGENNPTNDPWNNIFRRTLPGHHPHHFHLPGGDIVLPPLFFAAPPPAPPANANGGPEQMGMYDAEDGGIYRCLDCMHEIWDGRCTSCGRTYPGHPQMDDSEDDGEEGEVGAGARRRHVRRGGPQNMRFAQLLNYLERRGHSEVEPDFLDEDDEQDLDEEELDEEERIWGRVLDELDGEGRHPHLDDEDEFSGDEDERDIFFEEEEDHFDRHELLGVAHHHPLLGFPHPLGFAHPPPPGEILYAGFTDDEYPAGGVEQGVARVEEINDEDGMEDGEGDLDEEEAGYESSFIDDEEDRHSHSREYRHAEEPRVLETIDLLDLSADEDDDGYEDEDDNIANTMARLRQHRVREQDDVIHIQSDDEIDLTGEDDDLDANSDEDEQHGGMVARTLGRAVRVGLGRRGGGRGAPVVILDSDEEDEEYLGEVEPW